MVLPLDLFDGELHELFAGEDFGPASGVVAAWVETVVQPPLLAHESPLVNWVSLDPNAKSLQHYTVAAGWASCAIRLQKIAECYGYPVKVYEKAHRDSTNLHLSSRYFVDSREVE